MTRRFIAALAAFALAGAVSTAQAQDSSAMRAGVAKPSYQAFVSAVNATPATLSSLKSRPSITASEVTLVNVADFPEAQDDSAFNALVQPHEADIAQLRTTLGAQADVKSLLSSQSPPVTTDDIVAVGTQPDGKLVVFYKGKKSGM